MLGRGLGSPIFLGLGVNVGRSNAINLELGRGQTLQWQTEFLGFMLKRL